MTYHNVLINFFPNFQKYFLPKIVNNCIKFVENPAFRKNVYFSGQNLLPEMLKREMGAYITA